MCTACAYINVQAASQKVNLASPVANSVDVYACHDPRIIIETDFKRLHKQIYSTVSDLGGVWPTEPNSNNISKKKLDCQLINPRFPCLQALTE